MVVLMLEYNYLDGGGAGYTNQTQGKISSYSFDGANMKFMAANNGAYQV